VKRNTLTLGTRSSRLALCQAEQVAALLRLKCPGLSVNIRKVITQGDRENSQPLQNFKGVGVFVKELEKELLDGSIDAAVHSLKDMPTDLHESLVVASVPIREEWRDALVSASGLSLAELPLGGRIASGSPRRKAQILAARPDLKIEHIRGNVETRISKMRGQGMDGIVLSYAGLLRLGLQDQVTEVLDPAVVMPAPGQGAVAVEACRDDDTSLQVLRSVHDECLGQAVTAERELLRLLGGGCHVPIGALAQFIEGDLLKLEAVVCSTDGKRIIRAEATGEPANPKGIASVVSDDLLARGTLELIGHPGASE